MGAFVLGILAGWLLEWLFFNYWIKGRSTGKFADCSGLKLELSAKKKEISALKAELENTEKSSQKKIVDTANSKPIKESASANKSASAKESAPAKKSASAKENASSEKKPSAQATKKPAAGSSKATTKSKTASSSAKSKKTSEKKPAKAKKTSEKKPAKAKTSTASRKPTVKSKKDISKKPAKKVAKKTWDDFTKLSGIGPSISAKLNELGISTFQKLSEMDDDILRDMLEAAGARMNNNKEAMHTWNEQAALAAKGDFEGLKKLQESIKF